MNVPLSDFDQKARRLESDNVLALQRRINRIVAFLVGPAVVLNLVLQALATPCWQAWALVAAMGLTASSWMLAYLLARESTRDLAAALVVFPSLAFDAVALGLRQDTLALSLLANTCMVVYGSVFAPRFTVLAGGLAVGSTLGLRLALEAGWLHGFAPSPLLALGLDVTLILAALPVTLLFIVRRHAISELPYQALRTQALGQRQILEAVGRLQPQVDRLVEQTSSATRALIASSQGQVDTAGQVSAAAESFRAALGSAASVAVETQAGAEAMRREAADGLGRLAGVHGRLDSFLGTMDEVRARVEHLSAQTERTDGLIASIDEIGEQIALLALNAGLEAARAGETGRGFAVVAAELKRLVEHSASSLSDARGLLRSIHAGTAEAAGGVRTSSEQLRAHVAGLKEAAGTIERIATRFEESTAQIVRVAQASSAHLDEAEKVVRLMAQLRYSAGQQQGLAGELWQAVEQLARDQADLRDLVRGARGEST